MVSRHDFCVYAADYVDEEDLCVEVWGVAVGGGGERHRQKNFTRRTRREEHGGTRRGL